MVYRSVPDHYVGYRLKKINCFDLRTGTLAVPVLYYYVLFCSSLPAENFPCQHSSLIGTVTLCRVRVREERRKKILCTHSFVPVHFSAAISPAVYVKEELWVGMGCVWPPYLQLQEVWWGVDCPAETRSHRRRWPVFGDGRPDLCPVRLLSVDPQDLDAPFGDAAIMKFNWKQIEIWCILWGLVHNFYWFFLGSVPVPAHFQQKQPSPINSWLRIGTGTSSVWSRVTDPIILFRSLYFPGTR